MVKSNKKQQHLLAATDRGSVSVSGSANSMEHTYCVVLHVGQAINFYGRELREGEKRENIIMTAALNTVDFEVEGTPSATAETIVFNSNCIWECDMAGIKRIKTDHRPVKVTFYSCNNTERKTIGSLLLPLRGLPVLGVSGNNSPLQLKLFWHKLTCLNNEFRSHKPEVLLLLAIVKKTLLYTKDFKHLMAFNGSEKKEHAPPLQSPEQSITANMIQSQANIYVQSLAQLGLLQVGNDPLVDCDIVEVVLQFKHIKNVDKFVKSLCHGKDERVTEVLLMFDFLGSVTKINLKLNKSDTYEIKDVLGLRFKSSLRSIRLYFQRIFYLPFNLYIDGTSIANYRMDFGKLLPPDKYFADKRRYVHEGWFAFDRFGRMGSARELKPIIEFTFTVGILEVCWGQQDMQPGEQQMHLDKMSEQLDLQSVGSKAFIHEVPEDRAQDNLADDWQPALETASTGSLNVGAELSASDESASEASRQCRRKSTRLVVNNPLGQNANKSNVNDEQLPEDDYDDISFESEFLDICNIVEDPKRAGDLHMQQIKTASTEKIKGNAKDGDLGKQQKVIEWVDQFLNEDKKIQEQVKNIENKPTFRNGEEFDTTEIDDSFYRLEKESEMLEQNDTKEEPNRKLNNTKAVEEINKLKRHNSKLLSLPKEPLEKISTCPETIHDKLIEKKSRKTTLKKLSSDEALNTNLKTLQNRKNVLNTQEVDNANPVKTSSQKKCISPMSNLSPSKDELDKKPKKIFVVDPLLDTESVTESEKQKVNPCKNKSKLLIQSKTQASEKVIAKKAPTLKRTFSSKNDLTLGARWVKVGEEQTKVLNETEMYINDTCQETLNETDWSTILNNSSRSKLRENIKCSSEMESSLDSSYNEKPQVEQIIDKKQAKLLRPKTSREKELQRVEIPLTSEPDTTANEENISIRKRARRIVKNNTSLQEFLEAEKTIAEQVRQNLPKEGKSLIQKQYVQPDQDKETCEVESKNHINKQSIKSTAFKKPIEDHIGKLCLVAKKSTSQKDDAQVSHMELTMINTKCIDQSVNSDMDDSTETIIAAGRQLKDLMQHMQNLDKSTEHCSMEAHYEFKFKQIEQHIALLEQHLLNFECHTHQMQQNNLKLAEEKMQLKERIIHMEQQIAKLSQQGPSSKELQQVLSEMQLQNTRYIEMSKAKDQYKRNWRRSAKQVHALKVELYEKHMSNKDFDLKSMIAKDVVEYQRDYGHLSSRAELGFSGSGDGPTTMLKDIILGLTAPNIDEHDSNGQVDNSL